MKIGHNEIYQAYRDLVVHSEDVSWSRFESLLIINSILIVAWATLFAKQPPLSVWTKVVMTAISLLGITVGWAWSDLGRRGRQYLDQYKAKAKAIEEHHDKKDWWEEGIPITDRPFQVTVVTRRLSSSAFLLIWLPLLFSLMNVILLIATWM